MHCADIQTLDLSNNLLRKDVFVMYGVIVVTLFVESLPPQIRRLSHLQILNLANNPLHHYQFK